MNEEIIFIVFKLGEVYGKRKIDENDLKKKRKRNIEVILKVKPGESKFSSSSVTFVSH